MFASVQQAARSSAGDRRQTIVVQAGLKAATTVISVLQAAADGVDTAATNRKYALPSDSTPLMCILWDVHNVNALLVPSVHVPSSTGQRPSEHHSRCAQASMLCKPCVQAGRR
jgi:hypothetical protein